MGVLLNANEGGTTKLVTLIYLFLNLASAFVIASVTSMVLS